MSKSDKNAATDLQKKDQAVADANYSSGVTGEKDRIAQLTPIADQQGKDIWSGYNTLANDPNQGITEERRNALLSGAQAPGFASSGSSGGGGGGSAPAGPSYLNTFADLRGATGGFDAARLKNINSATGSLYDTSGNYGDTNTSVHGLQDFAKTGGLSTEQLSAINQPTLQEFAKTGGYDEASKANLRARANAGVASTYGNLKDQLTRGQMTSGQVGPGWSEAGFKLARQGAQAQGTQAQNTEAGIQEAVNAGRMSAASKLGDLGLGTAGLQSQNTLTGYTNSGQLANTRQAQIDAAKESAAGIDTNTQALINQTRLGAASGESQDTLGRMSIGSQAAAQAAALNAANQRYLISEGDQNRLAGLGGMQNYYSSSPGQLTNDQNRLLNYTNSQSTANNNLLRERENIGEMSGLGSDILTGVKIAGGVAGIATGLGAPLAGMIPNNTKPLTQGTPNQFSVM